MRCAATDEAESASNPSPGPREQVIREVLCRTIHYLFKR